MKLPIYDDHGGSMLSFARLDEGALEDADAGSVPACSIVVVRWGQEVLFGFNVTRQRWELPGGSLEAGESPKDAAIRELAEETGIRATLVSLVARAVCSFAGESSKYGAAVFATTLDTAPDLVANDELTSFAWWDPASAGWEGLSPVDAEIARRCLPSSPSDVN